MIKNILFDFARVLVEVDFNNFIKKMRLPSGYTSDQMFDKIDQTDLMACVEKGEISFQKFYEGVSSLIELKDVSLSEFESAWRSTIPREIPGMRDLVRELKGRGFRVAVLSNLDPVLEDEAIKKFGILTEFEKIFISYRIGLVKPDPAIFRYVLKEWEAEPQETLFIDDRPYHVEGAKSIGCQGIGFTSVSELKGMLLYV